MKTPKIYKILTILLPIQILFVQVISKKTEIIEHYYSRGIYPVISKFLRILLGWIPFSFGDLILGYLIFLVIKNVIGIFRNKFSNASTRLFKLGAISAIVYGCFYLFWGFNYFREPLSKNLELQQADYTTEEIVTTTNIIIDKINYYHFKITQNDTIAIRVPYTPNEIYSKAVNGYKNLSIKSPQLNYEQFSVKSSLMSTLQSYNGTSGYINPLTNEAQVNKLVPKTSMPATTCHEMAHQIGWAAENEANFIGFLASTHNDDMYFKYSGYRMAFSYLISELKNRDPKAHERLFKKLNKGIVTDYHNSYLHWQKFKNPIEPYIKKGYSSYLKANKQIGGIKTYNYVVDLIIAYHKKNDLNSI